MKIGARGSGPIGNSAHRLDWEIRDCSFSTENIYIYIHCTQQRTATTSRSIHEASTPPAGPAFITSALYDHWDLHIPVLQSPCFLRFFHHRPYSPETTTMAWTGCRERGSHRDWGLYSITAGLWIVYVEPPHIHQIHTDFQRPRIFDGEYLHV